MNNTNRFRANNGNHSKPGELFVFAFIVRAYTRVSVGRVAGLLAGLWVCRYSEHFRRIHTGGGLVGL